MDEAYRAKLQHWLTSMLLLQLFAVLWAAYVWFWRHLPLLAYNVGEALWQRYMSRWVA
ncbi:hypothetical protein [Aurantiacibacter gilvus]|uniref:Uncharacterized protein n=1 Tax=Aurantiacibacter gilvus TaxID=3139141 RepID=A0ABU9IHV4_9SPHN